MRFSLGRYQTLTIMNTQKHVGPTSFRIFLVIQLVIPLFTLLSASAQAPAIGAAPPTSNAGTTASEAERVIVTGSNIPTAEEVGPNPVLSYNRDIIEKSG